MSRLTAYLHPKCSTCEEARRWLAAREIAYTEKDIREAAPTVAELRTMLKAQGGQRTKLLNTSGLEYRKQALAARLPAMSDDAAFALVGTNGMFVKRPFLIGPGVALVGFDEQRWKDAFGRA
jgi:arsenate reductase